MVGPGGRVGEGPRSGGSARISGVLPTQLPEAIGDEPASDYLDFKEQPGLPFDRAIHLANPVCKYFKKATWPAA